MRKKAIAIIGSFSMWMTDGLYALAFLIFMILVYSFVNHF